MEELTCNTRTNSTLERLQYNSQEGPGKKEKDEIMNKYNAGLQEIYNWTPAHNYSENESSRDECFRTSIIHVFIHVYTITSMKSVNWDMLEELKSLAQKDPHGILQSCVKNEITFLESLTKTLIQQMNDAWNGDLKEKNPLLEKLYL